MKTFRNVLVLSFAFSSAIFTHTANAADTLLNDSLTVQLSTPQIGIFAQKSIQLPRGPLNEGSQLRLSVELDGVSCIFFAEADATGALGHFNQVLMLPATKDSSTTGKSVLASGPLVVKDKAYYNLLSDGYGCSASLTVWK